MPMEKLQKEGLFDSKRKRPIPLIQKKTGLLPPPPGPVIRDILHILNRRYINLHVLIFPAKVQGDDAAPSIVEGIRALNRFQDVDVLIVARGGGSIEDLWPFNEESVARAIAVSRIPVIYAVGHETDTTIADFVADLRAPTPSAAAELVVGKKSEFAEKVMNLSKRLDTAFHRAILALRNRVQMLSQHRALAGIPQRIQMRQQALDELTVRLSNGLAKYHRLQSRRMLVALKGLHAGQLRHLIEVKRSKLAECLTRIENRLKEQIHADRTLFVRLAGMLDSLSPLAVLERGYSIASTERGIILKESSQASPGENIRLRLYRGRLKCIVKETEHE